MNVFGQQTRKANKEHVCGLCRGIIQKGVTYERWAFADSCICEEIKVHTHCKLVLDTYLGRETEFDWSGVQDYVEDICKEEWLCRIDAPMVEKAKAVYEWLKVKTC